VHGNTGAAANETLVLETATHAGSLGATFGSMVLSGVMEAMSVGGRKKIGERTVYCGFMENVWIRTRQNFRFPTNVDKTWDPLKTRISIITYSYNHF